MSFKSPPTERKVRDKNLTESSKKVKETTQSEKSRQGLGMNNL